MRLTRRRSTKHHARWWWWWWWPQGLASWPRSPPGASCYTLRAVVCYFGHHYLAFVLSEELNLWLCFDDAAISLVGRWTDVCKAMLVRRMQPSLLIYEDVAGAAAPAAPAPGAA